MKTLVFHFWVDYLSPIILQSILYGFYSTITALTSLWKSDKMPRQQDPIVVLPAPCPHVIQPTVFPPFQVNLADCDRALGFEDKSTVHPSHDANTDDWTSYADRVVPNIETFKSAGICPIHTGAIDQTIVSGATYRYIYIYCVGSISHPQRPKSSR